MAQFIAVILFMLAVLWLVGFALARFGVVVVLVLVVLALGQYLRQRGHRF